jgi:ribosome-associated translation inhibitor RaiA
MQIPLQLAIHHLEPAGALTDLIRRRVSELERHFPRLVGCKVSVEEPNHHHRQGKGRHFRVCVELSVPGDTLVASREAPAMVSHENLHKAITQTFDAALRLLDTFAGRHRSPKRRLTPPRVRAIACEGKQLDRYAFGVPVDSLQVQTHEGE